MSTQPDRAAVAEAREAIRQADDAIPRLRAVRGELATLAEAVGRGDYETTAPADALGALARLLDDEPELSFLTDPVLRDEQTVESSFKRGRAVTGDADAVTAGLVAAADGEYERLRRAVEAVVRPGDGPMGIDTTTLEQVVELFETAIEAAIAAREDGADRLQSALADRYDAHDDPLLPMDEQPLALLPVRLETRFVDDSLSTTGDPTQLLVRVYPDQIHTDSHEEELTADERRWAKTFWATLWYAAHPDPTRVPDDPDAGYLRERLPAEHVREHVAEIRPGEFSSVPHERHRELKERAWSQLVDRFGRYRAAYLVHALEPSDADLADSLLTGPSSPDETDTGDGSGEQRADDGTEEDTEAPARTAEIDSLPDELASRAGLDPSATPEADDDSRPAVPGLSFPTVDRKPGSWTQQPRAELLPDRWIAVAEWSTGSDGETKRTAVAGDPIREPLAVGPSPESVAAEDLADERTDSIAPDRTEWQVDYRYAEHAGMALRLRLSELAAFDPDRGFDRLTVLGVKGSLDPGDGATALRELLDAHHYTDGLELLQQGASTNPTAGTDPGTGETQSPGVDVECVPPKVEQGDRTDGDLLARALALDTHTDADTNSLVGERHVFANVANADGTEQRDARHANSALWPATMGYYLQHIGVDNGLAGTPSTWPDGPTGADRQRDRTEHLLRLDSYRRHFVRYVRARGPFPALRVGDQPYGVMPAGAIETERDLSVVDHGLVYDLSVGEQTLADVSDPGTVDAMVNGGVDPAMLVDAGADPDSVIDAGAAPEELVADAIDPASSVDPAELAPDSLLQDGLSLTATSRLNRTQLAEGTLVQEELDAAGIGLRDIARGNVTDEQLADAGVTTEAIAELLLPPRVRELGITPRTLSQVDVTPGELVRGEFDATQLRKLGLSTRSVAEAILPPEAREVVTPRALANAGISPTDLVNGSVSTTDLQRAGVTTEQIAAVLLPDEVADAGVTPERVGEAVDLGDLFNGDVDAYDLQEAGLTTETLAGAVLPEAVTDAGVTPDALEAAGITPAAVINGRVTPEDIYEAGVTPEALADAGVLPDALAEVGSSALALVDSGLDPGELIERGLSPESLLDAGLTPDLLVEAGLAPKRLIDAGVHVATLVSDVDVPIAELLSAGASPEQLARVGAAIETATGGDIPAKQLVRAGFQAVDLLKAGADATGVAGSGARPSALREAGVDAGTLRDVGRAAGSLRRADYDPAELLDSGYTPAELLNGGFSQQALAAAGVPAEELADAGRAAAELLRAGRSPAELRDDGYGPEQLLEAGVQARDLVDAGFAAGELVDAGLSAEQLVTAGADVQELRAAGVSVSALVDAGVDPATLATVGAGAEQLLDSGFDPAELLDAGLDAVELEVAGVDVDDVAEAATEDEPAPADATDTVIDAGQYAVSVLEDPNRSARDLYSFSFDPALGTNGHARQTGVGRARGGPGSTGGREPDGGTSGVPVARIISADDRFQGEMRDRVGALGGLFDSVLDENRAFTASKFTAAAHPAAETVPAESMLVHALKRTAVTTKVRQRSWVYSGENPEGFSKYERQLNTVRAMGPLGGVAPEADTRPVRQVLEATGLTDIDPRLRNLKLFPSADLHSRLHLRAGQTFRDRHDAKFRSTIDRGQIAERSLSGFVDILLDSTPSELAWLGIPFPASNVQPTQEFAEKHNWLYADENDRVAAIIDEIEGAEDAVDVGSDLADGFETDPVSTLAHGATLATNEDDYGDTGYLHSLLRVLLQFGTLQAYVTARRRLGQAYGDPPDGVPVPADGSALPVDALGDPTPKALDAHPNVNRDEDDDYSYLQALQEAAKPYDPSTSIEPRMGEFADSLRYLADLDVETLSLLTRETLDLCSHRLDAWWTSLATKRLLELRETQRTGDGGSLDPEAVSQVGTAPRATLDPALLSNADLGPDTAAGALDVGPDPAAIADLDIQTASDAGDRSGPTADGGIAGVGTETETEETPSERVAVRDLVSAGDVATRETVDPSAVVDAGDTTPGLYVGGYGYVENLSVDRDGADQPEYIHAPSRQQATTAALLRSGYLSHEQTDGDNLLAVDLSAARVRAGMELLEGVRQGQSLGELLGHRFERQLRERTLWSGTRSGRRGEDDETAEDGVDLMRYADDFRAEYPATADSLERPDGTEFDSRSDREEKLAAREVVDGRTLVREWEQYPFGRPELPDTDSDEYAVLEEIIAELREALDATGDLLTTESVHQFAQGNFQRAGGSLDALARGDQLPDLDVVDTPREHVGLSHRSCLLFDPTEQDETQVPPRTAGEPALAAWVETLLPAHGDVECVATFRYEDPASASARSRQVTATLADLDLGPLDVLYLFGADRQPSRSEIEQRLVYALRRDRPESVPLEAEIDLELTETASENAVSMADLLELARSIREFVGESRPITARDLAHPTDDAADGYDSATVRTLTDRADSAQAALSDTVDAIDERLSVLDEDHARGDAIGGETRPANGNSETPAAAVTGGPTVTEQVGSLSDALDETAAEVPLDGADSAVGATAPGAVRSELRALADSLPAGITDPDHVTAELTVRPEEGQVIEGSITDPPAVPAVGPDRLAGTAGADGLDDEPAAVAEETLDPSVDVADATAAVPDLDRPGSTQQFQQDVALASVPSETRLDNSLPEHVGSPGTDVTGNTVEPPVVDTDTSTELTVTVWGSDGLSTFRRERTVETASDGRFEATFDFTDVEPGTGFRLVARTDDAVVHSANGRVLAPESAGPGSTDPQRVLRERCETLTRLTWLAANRDPFDAGPLATLDRAVTAADWAGIQAERDQADPAASTVTQDDLALIDDLLTLSGADPAGLADALDRAVRPVTQLGLDRILSVTGDGPPADSEFWYAETAAVGDVRARIRRVLDNPTLYNEDPAPWRLPYAHRTGVLLDQQPHSDRIAAYLDAFLSGPDWLVACLDRSIERPEALLASLTTWLYSPADLDSVSKLATDLAALADRVDELPALTAVFEGLPTADGATTLRTFGEVLRTLAEAIGAEDTTPVPAADPAQQAFDDETTTALEQLGTELSTTAAGVGAVAGTAVADRFRNLVLERLREPMTDAAMYGIYGATPTHPDGGTPPAVRDLVDQAAALVERIRPRLADARALDPEVAPSLTERPVAARVDDQVDRLAAVFGAEFTVLPPFEPANGSELAASLTDGSLLPDDRGLAAETLLQRASTVRDRIDSFRETRSYAEALSGTPTAQMTVGQVPYEPGDTWVGADGVDPAPGKLSLLVRFGPGASAGAVDSRLTGLFVDQWNESVPAESETTGVALNYDDPSSRPPQSVLVVPPPEDGSWSLDRLAATVDETATYAKRRAVDVGDLSATSAFKLFPALFFPDHVYDSDRPPAGNVDFEMIQQYSRTDTMELFDKINGGDEA